MRKYIIIGLSIFGAFVSLCTAVFLYSIGLSTMGSFALFGIAMFLFAGYLKLFIDQLKMR